MKSKTISNSKYKNTGVLFELLVRQITAETLSGKTTSPAMNIVKKYFNRKTELGKELQLYRAFFEANSSKPLTEAKALDFIDLVVEQRKCLDERKLAREKYNLIKEIKEYYDLQEFLSCRIPNYTLHASVYKTFLNEIAKDQDYKILNVKDVATARFTLVEHLINQNSKRNSSNDNSLLEDFRKESEELRLLAYKFAIDKFNEKYANLNDKQKTLLREYINNVSSTNSLLTYVRKEIPELKKSILENIKKSKDKVISIKLNEVANQLDNIGTKNIIKDNEITALMIAYEILKEVS